MEVKKGNKLIAEFYNNSDKRYNDAVWVKIPSKKLKRWILINDLKYHSDWGWLMPVIERVKDIVLQDRPYEGILDKADVLNLYITAPIKTVWEQTVYFIEWYNQNQ